MSSRLEYRPRKDSGRRAANGRKRITMLNHALDFAFDEAGLSASQRLVWVAIWRHGDRDTNVSTVSYEQMATATKYTRRWCIEAVNALDDAGFLKFIKRGRRDRPNVYRLRLPS